MTKSKAAAATNAKAAALAQAAEPHKFQIDAFVSTDGPVKYTNKAAQGNHRQSQNVHEGAANPHNMDSLEPDSVQQSTAKQLSRVNNQSINQTSSSHQFPQQKGSKGSYLQRNLTEVGPQYNIKKNNFFTEPDESMIQQSLLM